MKRFLPHLHKILLAIAVILFFLHSGFVLHLDKVLANFGMLLLVHSGANVEFGSASSDLTQIRQIFTLSQQMNPQNKTNARGLALVYWQQGEPVEAQSKWQESDFTADEFVAFARNSHFVDKQTALPWYYLLERVEPDDPRLWLDVGLICQQQTEKDNICDRFLAFNNGNWLVDPELNFDRTAWHFNRKPNVNYNIESCPDMEDKQCLNLEISSPVPEGGASWHQCLHLEPDKEYAFSAWIKVEVPEDGQWRPAYFQGKQSDRVHGIGLPEKNGTSDWYFWEKVFVLPEFDDNWVCFYPVRLFSSGNAWFHEAKLVYKGE